MNPFIALAGVLVTFLAFYMQVKANELQLDLFNKNQVEQNNLLKEQMFFRLLDNVNQRIINFSHYDSSGENTVELTSYRAIDDIVKKFLHKIDYKCIYLGRHLLALVPELIPDTNYGKILQSSLRSSFKFSDISDLKQSIIEVKTYQERWEYNKGFIGSTGMRTQPTDEALKSIGHVLFYKIDFEERKDIYNSTYDEIYREYGSFLDGYTKNIIYLINFIDKNNNDPFFIEYIKSNLSTQELILVFYYCASKNSTTSFKNQIKKYDLLEGLSQARNRFIDIPSEIELEKEIQYVLN